MRGHMQHPYNAPHQKVCESGCGAMFTPKGQRSPLADMKSAQHGASPLSSVRLGRRGLGRGQNMEIDLRGRGRVGVGSGIWDVTRKSKDVSPDVSFPGKHPPPRPPPSVPDRDLRSLNPTPTPRRPDPPPSRKLRVDVSRTGVSTDTVKCGERSVGVSSLRH